MSEPISEAAYWNERLRRSWDTEIHHSVFRCPLDKWRAIEAAHKNLLAEHVTLTDSILDAGCGYGRLLGLLTRKYKGRYAGVDLSDGFIDLARKRYPRRDFYVADLRELPEAVTKAEKFDWAILISIRPMVIRNLGGAEWEKMEQQIRSCVKRIMFLEYDAEAKAEIIEVGGAS